MSETTITLIEELGRQYPAVQTLIDEHVSDNFGEILPHLFFGNLTSVVISSFSRATATRAEPAWEAEQAVEFLLSEQSVRSLLNDLEDAYMQDDEDVQELIVVSFLENLPRPDEEASGLREWLGPILRAQLRLIG